METKHAGNTSWIQEPMKKEASKVWTNTNNENDINMWIMLRKTVRTNETQPMK